ncbi:hypothetical protein H5T58_00405 [Candidatus Parcubacteria bacterium]|nr:hypothetical protein [Candidatus Parcubacteria bacterium]
MPTFYENLGKETNFERGKEAIKEYLKNTAEKIARDHEIPLDEECRIQPSKFEGVYSKTEIEADLNWVRQQKEKENREKKEMGETLEAYATALFNKHFGKELIIIRSSEYDDRARHVDNLILDPETGTVVCAFDEISEMSGPAYEEKRQKVLQRNLGIEPKTGGAKIKYGVQIEQGKKAKLGPQKHLPIFYLALSKDVLKKAVAEFSPQTESELERKILQYFLTSLESQSQALLLEEQRLSPQLEDRVVRFSQIIKALKEKENF